MKANTVLASMRVEILSQQSSAQPSCFKGHPSS